MPNKEVKPISSVLKTELLLAAKNYRSAAKKLRAEGVGGALYHAVVGEKSLYLRALDTAKNIYSYRWVYGGEHGLADAVKLISDYLECAESISFLDYLKELGKKYESPVLSTLPDVMYALIFEKISECVCSGKEEKLYLYLSLSENLSHIDFTKLFLDFSFTSERFCAEKSGVYRNCDNKTKLKYVAQLCELAKKEGKSEREKAVEIVKNADVRGVHIGELLFTKKKTIPLIYSICLIFMTAMIAAIYFLLCQRNIFALFAVVPVAISCYGAVKDLLSICFKYAGGDGLMRMDRESASSQKAVVAIMSIICGAEKDDDLFKRLENFYLADENPNRFYAIVCNLPDSDKKTATGDENIIENAFLRISALNIKYGDHFGIFLRRRRYSRSERKYIGWERKRGAVLEFCRFIRGKKTGIQRYIGNKEFLNSAKYLITLDSDTNLYAGAADELIGTIIHPLNRPIVKNGVVVSGHAIIQPHIAPTLESAAASTFATVTAGNGGIDSYASAAFDIYENVFENGSFCGKGILDIDVFLETCDGFFPNERILSHDLLEGNLMGAAIASDITLTDSTPKNAISYYTRAHRWIRGDLQTLPYLRSHVKNAAGDEIKNPMDALSKYKILDNVLGAVCPLTSILSVFFIVLTAKEYLNITVLFAFSYIFFPILRALVSLILPGGVKMASRRFYARIMPHIAGSFAYSFYKLCAMPYEAYIFADAAFRIAYRFLISKRNFLAWKTASAADEEKHGLKAYVLKMWISFAVGICALLIGEMITSVIGVLWILFPFAAYALSVSTFRTTMISSGEREALEEYVEHMWGFFRDLVNESTNFLPPDNYAISPVERIAYRTSPTNIGLYLVSLLGARDMGFISSDELEDRARNTAVSLSSMLTWRGHFYNWYDIKTKSVIGEPFISTVDSGNLLCALTSFCEGIKEYACECPALLEVLRMYEGIIKNMDISALYDKSARLFYIGYDVKNEKYSSSYYDTFMSESRMTSFYAVASGKVPREHFFVPSRPTVENGSYVGVASWSGTVFEYFMPALFLPVVPDSLSAQALCFAVRMEKKKAARRRVLGKKRKVFGVSESGYWHFDSEMNYQYKAFGHAELSLDPYCNNDDVISPYSSFLMLASEAHDCLDNLLELKELGAYGKYGFYEAVDFSHERVGNGYAVVKSFMAHHIGMSFISSLNLLKDGIFQKRFMRVPKMRAFYEMLCEKIPVSNRALPRRERVKSVSYNDRTHLAYEKEIPCLKHDILFPSVAMVSNNKTRIVASSSGHIAVYNGENVIFYSGFEKFSLDSGLCFYLVADSGVYALVPLGHTCNNVESTFDFKYTEESISYISHHKNGNAEIEAILTLSVFGDREMLSAECKIKGDFKKACLFVYGEPVMDAGKNFLAHKSFSGLFMESDYAEDEDILIFKRRSKNGAETKNFFGIKGYPAFYGGAFDTVRSAVLPLAYGDEEISELSCKSFSNTHGAMLAPMLSMKTYNIGSRGTCGFVFAFAPSEENVLYMLSEKNAFSSKRFAELSSLRYGVSGMGQKAAMLKNYLLRSFVFPCIHNGEEMIRYGRDIFWKCGISGESPIAIAGFKGVGDEETDTLNSLIGVFKYMCICGERFDLVIVYNESDLYRNTQRNTIEKYIEIQGARNFLGRDNGIHLLCENEFSKDELAVFKNLCEAKIELSDNINDICSVGAAAFDLSADIVHKLRHKAHTKFHVTSFADRDDIISECERGYFTRSGFVVKKEGGKAPFAHVMANSRFGCVLTENSLGFSYYENSALCKLSENTADSLKESSGEKLILRIYSAKSDAEYEDFDICACAYNVEYKEGLALYFGEAGMIKYRVEVAVEKEFPIKRISFATENPMELRACIFFAVSPCIGERKDKKGRYIFGHYDKTMTVSSVFESFVSLAISVKTENPIFYDDTAAFLSDAAIFGSCSDIACVGTEITKESGSTVFYLSALCRDLSKNDLDLFLEQENFMPCDTAPVFNKIEIKTDDKLFDISVNYFFRYQSYYSRFLARTGYYQIGGAYGFRDQLQDTLSFIESTPHLCRDQILRCAAHQYKEGDVAHWWHTFGGKETGLRSRYSDDLLWLPYALCEYVEKTGDTDILYQSTPYLCSPPLDEHEKERYEEMIVCDSANVYEHAILAAKLAYKRGLGEHSLLKFGGGDWNDGMNLVGIRGMGESVWLTEFCVIVYTRLSRLCNLTGDKSNAYFFEEAAKELYKSVKKAFCKDRYLRGYYDNGIALGIQGADECEIDSLCQSFAVFMEAELGMKISNESKLAMDIAYNKLYSGEYGIFKLLSPPFDKGEQKPGYIKGYLPGVRENGGQYTHAAVWAAMALLISGNIDRGIEVLKAINPVVRSAEAGFCDTYKIEPYALAGDVYSHPEHMGRGGWSHYTGAAAWYRKAVINCVFGLNVKKDGFFLDPIINEEFDGAELTVNIRKTIYRIRYSFCASYGIVLDGRIVESEKDKMKLFVFPFDEKEHTVNYCIKKKEI